MVEYNLHIVLNQLAYDLSKYWIIEVSLLKELETLVLFVLRDIG